MENKEIYIDGIDVSGCEHYEDLNCFAYRDSCGYPLDCKDNPNCYYKQLKRKEQECERLKKTVMYKCPQCGEEYLSPIGASLYEENYQLKAENDELKRQHQGDKGLITSTGKMNYQLIQEYDKLKNCLTEIKEISEKVYNDCDNCYGDVDTNCDVDCIDCTLGGKAKLAEQILQKISECEVENGFRY